jgi:uncharacterized coiled-coil protein SlyX
MRLKGPRGNSADPNWLVAIKKIGKTSISLIPEEEAVFVNASIKFSRAKDRIPYILHHIPRLVEYDEKTLKQTITKYAATAKAMKKQMMLEAIRGEQDKTLDAAKEVLAEQEESIRKYREELARNETALQAMEPGSKAYSTTLSSIATLKKMIDDLVGLTRMHRQLDKVEDAQLGLNMFKKKKQIEAEFGDKGFGPVLPQAKGTELTHNNIDDDLLES